MCHSDSCYRSEMKGGPLKEEAYKTDINMATAEWVDEGAELQ